MRFESTRVVPVADAFESGPPWRDPPLRRARLLVALISLVTALSACDGKGKAPGPAPEPADSNTAPIVARSDLFLLRRDAGQSGRSQLVARSSLYTLIREEARHAGN